jgi:hypothetical protein
MSADPNTLPLGTSDVNAVLVPMAPCPEPVLLSAAQQTYGYAAGFVYQAATNTLAAASGIIPLASLPVASS